MCNYCVITSTSGYLSYFTFNEMMTTKAGLYLYLCISFASLHVFSCTGLVQAPAVSALLYGLKFGTTPMVLIGSAVKFGIAAPCTRLPVELSLPLTFHCEYC